MRGVRTWLLAGFGLPLAVVLLQACSAPPPAENPSPEAMSPAVDLDSDAGTESVDRDEDLSNPFPYAAASLAKGQQLYRANCVDCHSMDGTGRDSDVTQDARDLTDGSTYITDGSDGSIFLVIRDGFGDVGQMPEFGDLVSEDEIWHMVNYLRSIRNAP